ncbi:putative ACR [uncultured archaeon]|nr:putative ACR [uncultured archaeon]
MKAKKISSQFKILKTFSEKMQGLMFSSQETFKQPLLFDFKETTELCKIHSFFCFFDFDAIWLDENHKIIYLKEKISPWKYGIGPEKARWLIEAKPKTIKKFKLKKGDKINIFNKN